MTNGEKYGDEIKKQLFNTSDYCFCEDFVRPKILNKRSCDNLDCNHCFLIQVLWLNEEYKEPGVDWSKVPVDTKIFVKDFENAEWIPRYFAMYKKGMVYAFSNGKTSFSVEEKGSIKWNFAKLAEVEDEKP